VHRVFKRRAVLAECRAYLLQNALGLRVSIRTGNGVAVLGHGASYFHRVAHSHRLGVAH
jgi:hypothetical protein